MAGLAFADNPSSPANLLTFDLEDWFHVLGLGDRQPLLSEWHRLPSRVEANAERILGLLSERGLHATFFILGWIAENHASLVKTIGSLGHEIACHGYGHDLISTQSREQFRHDLRRAKAILEDLTGKSIQGYRGPGFSITKDNLWAFDVIAEEGFTYDASLYPGMHGHGGMPELPRTPFGLITLEGHHLDEFPVTILVFGGLRAAFSGGGYFRLCPFPVMTRLISMFNRRGETVMVYLHPRDIDPETPRLSMPLSRRFKCYVNVSRAYDKLRLILSRHAFRSVREWQSSENGKMQAISLSSLAR